jgi:hypothetical protein
VLQDRATELEEQEAALDGHEIQALEIKLYEAKQTVDEVAEVQDDDPVEQATQALADKKNPDPQAVATEAEVHEVEPVEQEVQIPEAKK